MGWATRTEDAGAGLTHPLILPFFHFTKSSLERIVIAFGSDLPLADSAAMTWPFQDAQTGRESSLTTNGRISIVVNLGGR